MQSELGKLFVGGISWDTDEERLKEYFITYGEVIEAVIMKDRTTGRARGFGFVVFADPAVAERVVKEKHNIDGRMVEAKKAVPRDDQSTTSKSSNSIHGSPSPGPGRSRKIFVGGLASTVTEIDFKKYFEQFGTITDAVVMYDHNTQRPRGFGFITYDSEDAVDRLLLKTFHELNDKMVEVKRAVPKELSPGPSQSPLDRYGYGLNRMNNFLDSRFSPIAGSRSAFAPFASGYGIGLNFEPSLNPGYGESANINSSLSYGRGLNPYYSSNRFGGGAVFDGVNGGNTLSLNSATRNLWGDGGLRNATNSPSSRNFIVSGSGNIVGGNFNKSGVWGSSSISSQGGGNVIIKSGNLGYGNGDNMYGLPGGYGGNVRKIGAPLTSYAASSGSYGVGDLADFYGSGLGYDDRTWRSKQDATGSLGYGLGNGRSDMSTQSSADYLGTYGVSKRQPNRGIGD
ncbi:heterogeneous nuclear ribonucleoprotein 1 [Nicotiana tabacum]|uniref:Heterogeneous nuclear ribonucleoprotein 1 n=4 Tax=Nicotiana tabacum TaxID=4097 RepID=A0A1S4B641_TOBAC|nr:PREDICTED: heterogeneous nuclear ribonucleoprotein 1-like [Nicotiana tabacum]XP_016484264.1 PREDICTED: heterogeneous nuclear ribonucleoprotein 1-like [Nicotiana tabacum]XP_016484265.1 PREDICTED: heterogeneous nuclear ribonucleoprotein 1-like [Nicotiana tabacum]